MQELFNPKRLNVVKMRRGMSSVELATSAGISERALRNHEKGQTQPSPAVVEKLSVALEVPIGFFFADSPDFIEESAVSFRAASRITKRSKRTALAAGSFAVSLREYMSSVIELPVLDIPFLEMAPEQAAETLRDMWSLGVKPAPNMIHLLESKGVFITALVEPTKYLDAFCFWRDEKPFVCMNTTKTAERSRLDLAHELGHLVLHREIDVITDVHEQEAQLFGAAFLLPKNAMLASPLSHLDLEDILVLKSFWQTSATLFVRRMFELGMLTQWHYRELMIKLSTMGYRSGEPDGINREQSLVFAKAFKLLRAEGISMKKLAIALNMYPKDIREMTFGLTIDIVP